MILRTHFSLSIIYTTVETSAWIELVEESVCRIGRCAGAGVVWLELLQLVLVGCVARLVARGVVCAGTHNVDKNHTFV